MTARKAQFRVRARITSMPPRAAPGAVLRVPWGPCFVHMVWTCGVFWIKRVNEEGKRSSSFGYFQFRVSRVLMQRLGLILCAVGATALQSAPRLGARPRALLPRATPSDDAAASDARQFCEESAAAGADAVRDMPVEERVRRAMQAEAIEDRILETAGELEDAQNAGDAEKCEQLTASIRAMKEQYSALVGAGSSMFVDAVSAASGKGTAAD